MTIKVLKTTIRGRSFTGGRRREYNAKPRVYVWPQETIIENLMERRNRPVKLFRYLATRALESEGLTRVKLRWSQTAGCSCGCSPGFILDDFSFARPADEINKDILRMRFDVSVDVGTPEVVSAPEVDDSYVKMATTGF